MKAGSDRFQRACWFELDHETEFNSGHQDDYSDESFVRTENVPGDPGGVTRYGIDASGNPGVDVPNLTFDGAVQIYLDKYWTINGHSMDETPLGWGEVLFDIHVNGGNGVQMAQRAAAMCGVAVNIDGVLGPETISAMDQAGDQGLSNLLHLRQDRYDVLAQENPGQFGQFLAGWTQRNDDLAEQVGVAV